MKKSLFLVLGILISLTAISQGENMITEKQARIVFEKTKVFPENTELSIAFIKNGQVFFYGVKRVNDTIELANNSNSLFEIGSITKVFTSTLLANFVLNKNIKLNDLIQNYFNFPIQDSLITVLHLANHTSGLPALPSNLNLDSTNRNNPYRDYGKDHLTAYLTNELKVNKLPGTSYEYSNVGAGILGFLLENLMDSTYEVLLQKYILSKYDMTATSSIVSHDTQNLVIGLDSTGNQTSNWDLNALVGAGGIISTTVDLSKFAIAQFDTLNKAFSLTRQSTFEMPQYRMKIGLAWNIVQPDTEHIWYMHNGGTGGYSSIMALDTNHKNGIIILSNVSAFNPHARNIDQLCLGLMKSQF